MAKSITDLISSGRVIHADLKKMMDATAVIVKHAHDTGVESVVLPTTSDTVARDLFRIFWAKKYPGKSPTKFYAHGQGVFELGTARQVKKKMWDMPSFKLEVLERLKQRYPKSIGGQKTLQHLGRTTILTYEGGHGIISNFVERMLHELKVPQTQKTAVFARVPEMFDVVGGDIAPATVIRKEHLVRVKNLIETTREYKARRVTTISINQITTLKKAAKIKSKKQRTLKERFRSRVQSMR